MCCAPISYRFIHNRQIYFQCSLLLFLSISSSGSCNQPTHSSPFSAFQLNESLFLSSLLLLLLLSLKWEWRSANRETKTDIYSIYYYGCVWLRTLNVHGGGGGDASIFMPSNEFHETATNITQHIHIVKCLHLFVL